MLHAVVAQGISTAAKASFVHRHVVFVREPQYSGTRVEIQFS